MTKLQVDTIQDSDATGAVNIKHGYTVNGASSSGLTQGIHTGSTEPSSPSNGDLWKTEYFLYIYMESDWHRIIQGSGVSTYNVTGDWYITNIAQASYDDVAHSFSSVDNQPYQVTFADSGTKLYMVGGQYDKLYQYSMSTAYDISTLSYVGASGALGISNPFGMAISSDGTKAYIINYSPEQIREFSMSTAYDVSTLNTTPTTTYSLTGLIDPNNVVFSSDGTKFYVCDYGTNNRYIKQYNMTTAWDVSTASAGNVLGVGGQLTAGKGIAFNSDGRQMFLVGTSSDSVHQYALTTPWEISSASYDSMKFSVSSQESGPLTVLFNNDGTKMYICGWTDAIRRYSTGL